MGQTGSGHSRQWEQPVVQAGRNEEHVWGSTGVDWMEEGGHWRGLTFVTGSRVSQRLRGGMCSDSREVGGPGACSVACGRG